MFFSLLASFSLFSTALNTSVRCDVVSCGVGTSSSSIFEHDLGLGDSRTDVLPEEDPSCAVSEYIGFNLCPVVSYP